jgi:predicted TIM-barrel fold metal-dependent hydrolase
MYEGRLPAKFKDIAPKVVRFKDGGDAWSFGGRESFGSNGNNSAVGKNYSQYRDWGWTYEDMRPGEYNPVERLKDMDIDGIYSAMLFGGRGRGASLELDGYEYYMACSRAWNDHVLEDWQGTGGERLVALPVMPATGVDDAVAELQRVVKKGARGVTIGGWPSGGETVSWDDDRFWAAAQDADVPVAVHLGFNSYFQLAAKKYVPDPDGRWSARMAIMQTERTAGVMGTLIANLIYHGVFERFPRLTFLSVETGCGWIPFYAEQLDDNFQRHRFWARMDLKLRPSEYLKRNVLATFQIDLAAIKFREGFVDNFMWSTDYPHTGCDWPNSQKMADFHLQGVPEDDKWQILGGNFARIFKLRGAAETQPGASSQREAALTR